MLHHNAVISFLSLDSTVATVSGTACLCLAFRAVCLSKGDSLAFVLIIIVMRLRRCQLMYFTRGFYITDLTFEVSRNYSRALLDVPREIYK